MRIKAFAKHNAVMLTAFAAAAVTVLFVPIDSAYAGYLDMKTLICLFCVLAVVCALRDVDFFYILACRIVRVFKTTRMCILTLVYISFLGSMLITNDTALLTFLPLGYFVLSSTGKQKYLPFTFIMQNMAANLGGMLPPFLVSMLLITVCCLFVKLEPLSVSGKTVEFKPKPTALNLALFAVAVAVVLRALPLWVGLVVIPAVLLVTDRHALEAVDYSLLLTFVFFFVFAGNMARIDAVRDFFSALMDKNTLLYSALSCQVISNVPSAILLSQFTQNYAELLRGVNIGGAGTLIASLASLITFNEYMRHEPKGARRFIIEFSAFNFAFLAVLLIIFSIF